MRLIKNGIQFNVGNVIANIFRLIVFLVTIKSPITPAIYIYRIHNYPDVHPIQHVAFCDKIKLREAIKQKHQARYLNMN